MEQQEVRAYASIKEMEELVAERQECQVHVVRTIADIVLLVQVVLKV